VFDEAIKVGFCFFLGLNSGAIADDYFFPKSVIMPKKGGKGGKAGGKSQGGCSLL
jgi:hypothetical protein